MSDQLSRDAFDKFAAEHAGTLFTGKVTSSSAPFYIAIWQAAIEWDRAQAAPQPEAVARALELADDLERWGRNAARDELVKLQPNMVIEMARRIRAALSAAPHPTGGKP